MARLDTVLSFSRDDDTDQHRVETDDAAVVAYDNGGSSDDDDDAGFEFAFAPPLGRGATAGLAPADDLFAHGRILPAYPVFERAQNDDDPPRVGVASASHLHRQAAAPPSPDTYCAWAPRSAPGSPARSFPIKSASTGEARRFWRLPGLGGGGRSHSDGKEKFVFLHQPGNNTNNNNHAAPAAPSNRANTVVANKQHNNDKKQSKKKKTSKAGAAATEMDMATAHRIFYGKQGALPGGAERKQHSYLPYRTGIVGFFATAHAIGKSHHPY